MVHYCANPVCHAEFWILSSGDLYALERRLISTEFFWLCPACARPMTLGFDSAGAVSAASIPDPASLRTSARLMSGSNRSFRYD